jgi:hypothetical protein
LCPNHPNPTYKSFLCYSLRCTSLRDLRFNARRYASATCIPNRIWTDTLILTILTSLLSLVLRLSVAKTKFRIKLGIVEGIATADLVMNAVRIAVIKLSKQGDILKERSYKGITVRISKIRPSGLVFGIRNYITAAECMDRKSFHLVGSIGKAKVPFIKRTASDAGYKYPISE